MEKEVEKEEEEEGEGDEGVIPAHELEAQGYRAPGAWVYGEGEEEGDEEGDLPLRSGAGGSDAEGCAEDAPDGAGLPEYASSQAAVEGMLSALDLEYAACQAAGGAGSATVAALPPPLDPGPPPDASTIRSPLVAAAFAGRPDLRAKLEALKRLKSTWVSFEGGEGEGAGAGAAEEEFPEDYAALQRADAEALAAARAASAAPGSGGSGEGVDWADFALADPPPTGTGSAPPAAASAARASGEQALAGRGGAPRAVSPLALAKKQAIADVMSRFTLTPKGANK